MHLYLSLGRGPKFYLEVARWADLPRGLILRWDDGELIVWLGRLHMIYTPADWQPAAKGPSEHGPPPRGSPPPGEDIPGHRMAA